MNQIREYRKKCRLSQEKLAEMVGVDRSNVAKWEAGVHKPRADMLILLAKVLQCSVDELLREGDR